MIESIGIKNLRGIREGTLEGLTRLTVLVGPNSSGKSTILDALWIAASNSPGDAVGRAVRRRTERDADARWLLWRKGSAGAALLAANAGKVAWRRCTISLADAPAALSERLRQRGKEPPFICVENLCQGRIADRVMYARTVFSSDNSYEFEHDPETFLAHLKIEPDVRFIDMRSGGTGTLLPNLYTDAVTQGSREEVRELLRSVVPGLSHIEILVNQRSEPVLHLVFSDKSVPVALVGDGIRSLLRLSLELAPRNGGLALIEEPEVHQHPRAIQQSVKALLASIRRGTQIVLSTHSLELIDALLLEATQDDLQHLSTYRLRLEDGVLVSSRFGGDQMAFARGQIEEDLR